MSSHVDEDGSREQSVLIAGATGNIGLAAAIALVRRGDRVVLLGRKIEKLGDLESIQKHDAMTAFNRTKTCNRVVAGEMARRSTGKVAV